MAKRSRYALDRWSGKEAFGLLIVVLTLVVVGVRFERTIIAVALSAVLVVLFAVRGHHADNRDPSE